MAEVTPLSLDDYDAIADAVQETERGRWFLTEFARRNRAADTAVVLRALDGLERRIALQEKAPPPAAALIRQALDCARLARAAPADEAAALFDDLERVLSLAAEALGDASPAVPAIAPTAEEPPAPRAPLALAPPVFEPEFVEDDETETVVSEQDLAWVGEAPGDPSNDASPPLAPEEFETAQEPAVAILAPAARAAPARSHLLLDSLSEAEKAILFA
ncbi:hypothetical protein [Methylopila sp. M107]|uniref:hypothetical protein n=1 Tax=Methylopila sp. M107 TaxID=1101190 RepID=UPI000379DEC5|nr:hypothetical protein [Methylopila sp. M107]